MATSDDFAAELKKARLAAGLSQAQLGEKAGLTGSYVCVLELRRKPAPGAEVVRAIAKALAIDEQKLQELAALERTPEPVRQRVMRLVKERGRTRRTRDRLLTTTLFHMTRKPGFLPDLVADALGLPEDRRLLFGRLAHKVKQVPSEQEAESQSNELLKEVTGKERDAFVRALPRLLVDSAGAQRVPSASPDAAEKGEERPWRRVPVFAALPAGDPSISRDSIDSLHLDRRLWAPGSFVLVAADDEAFPRVERGDWILVHPSGPLPSEGSLVVLREGGRTRLRVLHRQGDEIRLDAPRGDSPPLRLAPNRFDPVGVVAWVLKPLAGAPPPRRRDPEADPA